MSWRIMTSQAASVMKSQTYFAVKIHTGLINLIIDSHLTEISVMALLKHHFQQIYGVKCKSEKGKARYYLF